MLDGLTSQDLLSFTGSAATAAKLRSHPVVIDQAVRFNAEADSLNACVLQSADLLDLWVKEVAREVTQKAGQKCTAVRRAFVPRGLLDDAALLHAEGGLAVQVEVRGDRPVPAHELGVGVDELGREGLRDPLADRRLAGPHRADQDHPRTGAAHPRFQVSCSGRAAR